MVASSFVRQKSDLENPHLVVIPLKSELLKEEKLSPVL